MQSIIRQTKNNNFILIVLKSLLKGLVINSTKIDFKAEISSNNETLENNFANNA